MSVSKAQIQEFHRVRRKSLARRYYYGERLTRYKKYKYILEGVLTFATAGTVTSLGIWQFIPGMILEITIAFMALLAFILSIIKTQWDLSKQTSRYHDLYYSYSLMEADFEELQFTIQKDPNFSDQKFDDFFGAARRRRRKIIRDEDPNIDEKIYQSGYLERADSDLPKLEELRYIPPEEHVAKIQEGERG